MPQIKLNVILGHPSLSPPDLTVLPRADCLPRKPVGPSTGYFSPGFYRDYFSNLALRKIQSSCGASYVDLPYHRRPLSSSRLRVRFKKEYPPCVCDYCVEKAFATDFVNEVLRYPRDSDLLPPPRNPLISHQEEQSTIIPATLTQELVKFSTPLENQQVNMEKFRVPGLRPRRLGPTQINPLGLMKSLGFPIPGEPGISKHQTYRLQGIPGDIQRVQGKRTQHSPHPTLMRIGMISPPCLELNPPECLTMKIDKSPMEEQDMEIFPSHLRCRKQFLHR